MIENMYRRPRHNGDEQDAFSREARKNGPVALGRAGVVHKTKTRAARRTTAEQLRTAARAHESLVNALVDGRLDVNRIEDYAILLAAYDDFE